MELKLVTIFILALVCVAEARSMKKKKTAHARSFGGKTLSNQARSTDVGYDYSNTDTDFCDEFNAGWYDGYMTFSGAIDTYFYCVSMYVPKDKVHTCIVDSENDDGSVNIYDGEACVCDRELYPCDYDFEPKPEDERLSYYKAVSSDDVNSCLSGATEDESYYVNVYGFVNCLCDKDLYPCYYDYDSSSYLHKKEWDSSGSESEESGDDSGESEESDYSYDSSSYYEDKRTASSGSDSDESGDYTGSGDYSDESDGSEDSYDSTSYWKRMNENKRTEVARKSWKARNIGDGNPPQQKRHGPAPINAKRMQALRSHLRTSGKQMRDVGGEHKNSERMMTLLKQLRELKSKKTSNHQKN